MVDNNCFGLIKFFKDHQKLEMLQNGLFFCNTPEFYRLSGDEGVSDLHESCVHSYRRERGDDSISLKVDGHEVGGISSFTQHRAGFRDHWLHCWFKISIPEDDDHLEKLATDINRMRKEFGAEYAFIPGRNLFILLERLQSVSDQKILHGPVNYSSNKLNWSAECKSENYSYQREYRFLIGECQHTSVEPLRIQYEKGFSDLIWISPILTMTNQKSGVVWFKLGPDGCFIKSPQQPIQYDDKEHK